MGYRDRKTSPPSSTPISPSGLVRARFPGPAIHRPDAHQCVGPTTVDQDGDSDRSRP